MRLTNKDKKEIGDDVIAFLNRQYPHLTKDQQRHVWCNLYQRFREQPKSTAKILKHQRKTR